MKLIKKDFFIIHSKFKSHLKYKKDLLDIFNQYPENKNNYANDHIYKLDFDNSSNKNRKWTQLIANDLLSHFKNCANKIGYKDVLLNNLWFQQYNKNSRHNWHIHGGNYSGVYYVDFKEEDVKTKLVDCTDQSIYSLDIKEGDIILFPAFVIHESGIQLNNNLKTIISFNIDFNEIKKEILDKLNASNR